ncbi:MAG: tetratricopeptide repeat protein [Pseudobdellovibrionaceae bacterium]
MKSSKLLLSSLLLISLASSAQSQRKAAPAKKAPAKPAVTAPANRASVAQRKTPQNRAAAQLSEALSLARAGSYDRASVMLYRLSRNPELAGQRQQIKYLLGVSLMEQKNYQVAAFQFVDVIRNGESKYTKQAIEKLSLVADALGDDSLLNYAISRVRLDDFPEKYKDMVYFRLGEIKLKNKAYAEAVQSFARVPASSKYYSQALFNRGLAHLEAKQTSEAQKVFEQLLSNRTNSGVTDTNRVAAQMALARTLYQAQDWDASIEAYRQVPRDHEFWHDALFEQSWAYLRAAKFRSALSNFQSLHSTFYEDHYLPESLLLRSIVFLYICKYDEMEKVLDLFERSYGTVRAKLGTKLNSVKDPIEYYQELEKAQQFKLGKSDKNQLKTPYSVLRYILGQGDVKRSMAYLKTLQEEKQRMESNPVYSRSGLLSYGQKILNNRMRNTRIAIGEMSKGHMGAIRAELRDLYEQAGFVRYEMINGRKETLKKKIAGKDIPTDQIDENVKRDFFVQNGYEYYPFQGEYWLDEVGNYHYLGKQSCE